jgi:arylsulfatase A-like enzyme
MNEKMMRKPNVILVLTDDQGYGDLGCHGNEVIKTPNIDSFYQQSSRFTNYHVGPTCAPTRAGLFTGHYANSTGVWHTIGGRSLLRKDEWTIADAMKQSGYRTAIFGKWHLGDEYPYLPHYRGFETSLIHKGGGISQVPDHWGNDYFDDTYFFNGEPVECEGYCTDVWFDEAVKFIETNKDAPFLCCITPNAPHSPYNVPKKYSDMYKDTVGGERASFYGMITNIDENFGKLRDKLCSLGIEDDTILIFMTDNGTSCGAGLDEDGFVIDGYNAGMRGTKAWPYEGGHRTPFFLRWPGGGIDKAADIGRLTANVDFMPTILDLCGIGSNGRSFHGKSLKPLLYGEGWQERIMVTDSQRLTRPLKWRLSCVMNDNYRLINGTSLYDISADPEQRRDISEENPQIVEKFRAEYDKWWDVVSQQFGKEIPLSIGSEQEEKTVLRCHDWRNEPAEDEYPANLQNMKFDDCNCPWHQGHIRQAMNACGYWELDVCRSGDYVIELCRWPEESAHNIRSGIDGDDIEWRAELVPQSSHWLYTGGKALDITEASINIDGREYSAKVEDQNQSVKFEVSLEKGPAHLSSQFRLADGSTLGAYYVYVIYKS